MLEEASKGNMFQLGATINGLNKHNPEGAQQAVLNYKGSGAVIGFEEAEFAAKDAMDASIEDGLATLMVHGMIHNSLCKQNGDVNGFGHLEGTIMTYGSEIKNGITGKGTKGDNGRYFGENKNPDKTLEDYWCDDANCSIKKDMERNRGTNKPKDNYEQNKRDANETK